jgi:hypothetical protein
MDVIKLLEPRERERRTMSHSIESSLFDHDVYRDILEDGVQFYECTLKVQIGPYAPGTFVPCIAVQYSKGVLQFFQPDPGEAQLFYTHPVRLTLA